MNGDPRAASLTWENLASLTGMNNGQPIAVRVQFDAYLVGATYTDELSSRGSFLEFLALAQGYPCDGRVLVPSTAVIEIREA